MNFLASIKLQYVGDLVDLSRGANGSRRKVSNLAMFIARLMG